MGGYVTLPSGWTADEAAPWIDHARRAAALPPKAPTVPKATTTATANKAAARKKATP